MNILADASLPGLTQAFPAPFQLSLYEDEASLRRQLPKQDVLLCRSTLAVTAELLQNHRLYAVATASSGSDHIDKAYLAEQGIRCLDAKGSNALSVADYVLACLAYLERARGISGKVVGILGLGFVGLEVARRLRAAQYQVHTFDPLKAQREAGFHSVSQEVLYDCDILCIHAEFHRNQPYPSANLINKAFLERLKPHCILINAARGGIVDEEALLQHRKPLIYCTDVYQNEPNINPKVVEKATLCTPHIAGHSLEAKFAALAFVSTKLHELAALPLPIFAKPPRPKMATTVQDSRLHLILGQQQGYSSNHSPIDWQDLVLSLYNPGSETEALQKAQDKQAAFLTLRKQHQQRHDFATYLVGV